MVTSKAGFSASGPDDFRFAHLQALARYGFDRSKFPEVIRPFWRLDVEYSNSVPPESWSSSLEPILVVLR